MWLEKQLAFLWQGAVVAHLLVDRDLALGGLSRRSALASGSTWFGDLYPKIVSTKKSFTEATIFMLRCG
ncbi:MAG: hypothetical protein ACK5PS_09505 [Desulfopila sp.]